MTESSNSKSPERILDVDPAGLVVVKYPDPILNQVAAPLPGVDDSVRAVIDRMFEIMFETRGVGLAGPQVGLGIRLFVASPSFHPDDRHVYVNPEIINADGVQEDEEGCLSVPGVNGKIKRKRIATIRALDRDGNEFEETGEDLTARIFQHETDHLNGKLLIDRMGTVARLANRRALRDLEKAFAGS